MMKTSKIDPTYWEKKYEAGYTGWDIGHISPPIKAYIEQLKNKEISILIPGAGNAYEAEYLFNSGFKNITVLDFAKYPLDNLKKRIPNFPDSNLCKEDFFEHQSKYDLILEQTFFCALDPSLRKRYAQKMNDLLNDNGIVAGVLFDFPLTDDGPPYGGSLEEYKNIFSNVFKIKTLDRCFNSLKPRLGTELFIIFEKKMHLKNE